MAVSAHALRVPGIMQQSSLVTRRTLFAAGVSVAAMPTLPALAEAKPPSDGKWAQRFDEFTDADFEGFSTTPSGLQYKIFDEGYGVKPVAGQKIKAHCE